MPITFKKTKKRSKSQKKSDKKRGMYTNVSRIPKTLTMSPFSGTQKVVHKYVENGVSLNPGTGSITAQYVFSVNGMYDPNVTGSGHQPSGFDQMAAMFEKYTVINAQIRVKFSNQTSTGNRYVVGVVASSGTGTLTRHQCMEGHSSWDILEAGSISGKAAEAYLASSPGQFFAISKLLSETDVSGTSSGNPSRQYFFHVFAADEGALDPPSITATVEIAYTAIWHQPKQLSES